VRRRDLPRDTVRRWYAETLLLLESRGVVRPPGATPREYAGIVGGAIPECRPGFEALTGAYEEVRYAGASLDRGRLHGVRRDRGSATAAIRRVKRVELPDESGHQAITSGASEEPAASETGDEGSLR
jgi:hypothetical protein